MTAPEEGGPDSAAHVSTYVRIHPPESRGQETEFGNALEVSHQEKAVTDRRKVMKKLVILARRRAAAGPIPNAVSANATQSGTNGPVQERHRGRSRAHSKALAPTGLGTSLKHAAKGAHPDSRRHRRDTVHARHLGRDRARPSPLRKRPCWDQPAPRRTRAGSPAEPTVTTDTELSGDAIRLWISDDLAAIQNLSHCRTADCGALGPHYMTYQLLGDTIAFTDTGGPGSAGLDPVNRYTITAWTKIS